MSPARPSQPVAAAPAPRVSGGVERVVALALAVMAAVLGVVYVDLVRAPAPEPPPPFDFVNPMLSAHVGECVELSAATTPELASWLVVRSPGVVLRPHRGDAKIAGWSHPRYPDARTLLPYLVCDARSAPVRKKPGAAVDTAPPPRDEPYLFPLNGFGLPLEAMGVLSDIAPTTITWGGQTRKGYAVGIRRYGQLEGPWVLYLSKDAPVLGTMKRSYLRGPGDEQVWLFRVPESCR
ncbi:MAG: hypothetical protein IT460_13620 [Planctomycetes bacterium]|nr:hypothetical protein [Planctomycetota bacterium]